MAVQPFLAAPIDAIVACVLRFDFGEAPLHRGHVGSERVEVVVSHVPADGAKTARDVGGA